MSEEEAAIAPEADEYAGGDITHRQLLVSMRRSIHEHGVTLSTGIRWNRWAIVGLAAIGAWVVLRVDNQIDIVTARFESFQSRMSADVSKLETALNRTAISITEASSSMIQFDRTLVNIAETQRDTAKTLMGHVTEGAHGTAKSRLDRLENRVDRIDDSGDEAQ